MSRNLLKNKKKLIPFNKSVIILFGILTGFGSIGSAQTNISLDVQSYVSDKGEVPFWFHQQKYGLVHDGSANALSTLSLSSELYRKADFSISVRGDLLSRLAEHSTISANLYSLKAQIGGFVFNSGRFKDPLGESESELSSGSFMISRNTTPIPRIALYTDDYVTIPGTFDIVSIKGLFAHGWFGKNRYTNDAYLHQKYFFLRLSYDWLSAFGGIIHNTQWSGRNDVNGKLPGNFDAFLEAAFALGSSSASAPGGEISNAVGNSVAGYDFGLQFRFEDFYMEIRRLFYLEDKIASRLRSMPDGIWRFNIEPTDGIIKEFLYEHIHTKRQDKFDFEPYGPANYYNHYLYRTGWTYQGNVLGNSLILMNNEQINPVYNNIVIGHHLGVQLGYGKFNQIIKYTYTRNYGTVTDQIIQKYSSYGPIIAHLKSLGSLRKDNHSMYSDWRFKPGFAEHIELGIQLAVDVGEMITDNIGIGFSFRYDIYRAIRE